MSNDLSALSMDYSFIHYLGRRYDARGQEVNIAMNSKSCSKLRPIIAKPQRDLTALLGLKIRSVRSGDSPSNANAESYIWLWKSFLRDVAPNGLRFESFLGGTK